MNNDNENIKSDKKYLVSALRHFDFEHFHVHETLLAFFMRDSGFFLHLVTLTWSVTVYHIFPFSLSLFFFSLIV